MKRIFLFCLVAHAVGAFADEPAWPSDFWDQVAASRAAAAASGEVRVTSGEALPAFGADAKVWKAAWAKATKAAALAFAADKAKAAKTLALKKGIDTNVSIKVAEVR